MLFDQMAWADDLKSSPVGELIVGREGYTTFLPTPLPQTVQFSIPLVNALDQASRAVSLLAGVGETLPNPDLLIRPFLTREAILSSRIEGTIASASDVFKLEASDERAQSPSDAREVLNYVHALRMGVDMLNEVPISTRLVRSLHERLMTGVRGRDKRPGDLREQQVWIAAEGEPIESARFVPPPAEYLEDLLRDWSEFANLNEDLPVLVQCAMLHYQFETIHPFLDGNGRVGRLLIVLFLLAKEVLPKPLLYLSAYFERNRSRYYDHLFDVSRTGEWEPWLIYFLRGVEQESRDALSRSRRLQLLQAQYRERLQAAAARHSGNTFRLLDYLFASPFISAPQAATLLGITPVGARNILDRLVSAGILEIDRTTWPHFYVARELLATIE